MDQLKILFNKFNQKYRTFSNTRKLIVFLVFFVCFFLLFSDLLMFNNINAYKSLRNDATGLETQLKDLNQQIDTQVKNPTSKELKNLIERKNLIRKQVFDLKNTTVSSINSNEMLNFIENSIVFSNNLKLTSFKNLSSEPQVEGLQKHNFNLQVDTKDYSSLSDFIVKLEGFSTINKLSITRTEKGLTSDIDFYIFSNSTSILDISNMTPKITN